MPTFHERLATVALLTGPLLLLACGEAGAGPPRTDREEAAPAHPRGPLVPVARYREGDEATAARLREVLRSAGIESEALGSSGDTLGAPREHAARARVVLALAVRTEELEATVLPEPEPPPEAAARFRLVARPTELTMAERAGFRLAVEVTNGGAEALDPEIHRGTFTVNGARSTVAELAFSNGAQAPGWEALAPGATASMERALGEALFEAPGTYLIRYAREGAEPASVRVTVRE